MSDILAGMEQEPNVVKPVQKSASDLMQDTLNSTSKTLVWLQAHYQGIDRPDSGKGKKEPLDLWRFQQGDTPACPTSGSFTSDHRDGSQSEAFSKDSEIVSEVRFGQLGAKDAASLAGEDTAEEMEVTFSEKSRPSRQCASAGSSSEESWAKPKAASVTTAGTCQDQPGRYVIIHDSTFVSETPAVPREEDVVTIVRAGTTVEVVEVLREESQTRVRGRITFPQGWISLLDVASGYRWACRVEDRSRVQKPVPALDTSQGGAPTTPRASVMVAPPSSDRIGTVFRKPRAKTMHRRNQPKADELGVL
ncbi:unnamed protein product [Symbiodinium sp. CCMP2592]|nr:unnamed protein product [Symbiodinium sp. CCMP2592]